VTCSVPSRESSPPINNGSADTQAEALVQAITNQIMNRTDS
jgi:hypothetical protein